LQPGSSQRAAELVRRLSEWGLEPAVVATVEVPADGSGPEAAARTARYAALDEAADAVAAAAVLLGHTADDQAETVLLGLARGSGVRSLAGMRSVAGRYRRPLLGLDRTVTAGACAALQLPVWTDPHNSDPRFQRVRVRDTVLPVLERDLGPGVAAALARTAAQATADADALDALAAAELGRLTADGPGSGLSAAALTELMPAIGSRVLRSWLLAAGAPATDLGYTHVLAVTALVTSWHGQAWVEVPGGLRVTRRDGRLRVAHAPAVAG
jgi:tRNA(Ile)-lysidine synthase